MYDTDMIDSGACESSSCAGADTSRNAPGSSGVGIDATGVAVGGLIGAVLGAPFLGAVVGAVLGPPPIYRASRD